MRLRDFLTSRGLTIARGRVALALQRGLRSKRGGAASAHKTNSYRGMKQRVVPESDGTIRWGRIKDLDEHLRSLYAAFGGDSELCYFHAEVIVKIRRGIAPAVNIDHFFSMWSLEGEYLADNLDARWLVAAADTFIDYGNESQQLIGSLISSFMNLLTMVETEHAALDCIPQRDALCDAPSQEPFEIFAGMYSFRIHRGDMLRNLMERLDRAVAVDPTMQLIYSAVVAKAVAGNTLLARMMRANRHFPSV